MQVNFVPQKREFVYVLFIDSSYAYAEIAPLIGSSIGNILSQVSTASKNLGAGYTQLANLTTEWSIEKTVVTDPSNI